MSLRVHLIGFEFAVKFSPDTLPANRLTNELLVPAYE